MTYIKLFPNILEQKKTTKSDQRRSKMKPTVNAVLYLLLKSVSLMSLETVLFFFHIAHQALSYFHLK